MYLTLKTERCPSSSQWAYGMAHHTINNRLTSEYNLTELKTSQSQQPANNESKRKTNEIGAAIELVHNNQ